MNARSQNFELTAELRQIEEIVSAIFHTLLYHRSVGKFKYQRQEGRASSYSVGVVGAADVDCDFIDYTYVRADSQELDAALRREVNVFHDALRSSSLSSSPRLASSPPGQVFSTSPLSSTAAAAAAAIDGTRSGQISLEFYQKKRTRWPFSTECIPWEIWTLKLNVVRLNSEQERQICRERLGDILGEKIWAICDCMNRHGEYIPKMPNEEDLDLIFDTSFSDIQPYLYRITYQTSDDSASVGNSVRKFFKETLAL